MAISAVIPYLMEVIIWLPNGEKACKIKDANVLTPLMIEAILNKALKFPNLLNPVIMEFRKVRNSPITGPFNIDI